MMARSFDRERFGGGFFVNAWMKERACGLDQTHDRIVTRGTVLACVAIYCASAMGTSLNPLARALDFKLDSSRSMRFCSNFAAPRSTHAWPLVSIL